MNYRPDIDGLRAVAVLPVMLFHAGIASFSGGYVGVDIFFVISGYLITGILLEELTRERFSIAGFYERRVRRILPALYVMMLVCVPVSLWCLLSTELKDFARNFLAVLLYVSNFVFAGDSGYFDHAAELKPLLHTWSLAVEEQFYLLMPAVLYGAWRYARTHLLTVLWLLLLGSFLFALDQVTRAPVEAFYLLPSRAWELLLGAVVAVSQTRPAVQEGLRRLPKWARECLAWLALALIVGAIAGYDAATPFPGAAALPPTLGTALLLALHAGDTRLQALLACRPLVAIGLVSYSAYLWHQPLFAFARTLHSTPPTMLTMLGLSVLALLLAAVSWRYVEQPFRNRQRFPRARLWRWALFSSLLLTLLAVTLYGIGKHDPRRTVDGQRYQQLDQQRKPNFGLDRRCDKQFTLAPECRTSASPKVLIWGDSFAMHLVEAVHVALPEQGLVQLTKSACPPVLNMAPIGGGEFNGKWAEGCLRFNQEVWAWLANQPDINTIILSSPLTRLLDERNQLLTPTGVVTVSAERLIEQLREQLTVLAARGIRVIWVSPPPQSGADIGHCLTRMALRGESLSLCDFPRARMQQSQGAVRALLATLSVTSPVLDLAQYFCSGATCRSQADGIALYRDDGHLSHAGSRWLGQQWQPVLHGEPPALFAAPETE